MQDRMEGFFASLVNWLNLALDLIYPSSAGCPMCRAQNCQCKAQILNNYFMRSTCKRCGKFAVTGSLCGECFARGEGFPDKVLALAPYEGKMREVLHRFKFSGNRQCGKFLAELLLAGPVRDLAGIDLVIPVPLHKTRLRQRGFNQAEVLAKALALGANLPIMTDLLSKEIPTDSQASLARHQRLTNLEAAFRVTRPQFTHGKRILLVDDITTTGATLEACGLALRQAGAAHLTAICVAAGKLR
ncbi:MAG TPA: ComF family protein [Verrucomicrobiae bacterium]|nr:ComF family protein [Verrucomicrobiae bacterium]